METERYLQQELVFFQLSTKGLISQLSVVNHIFLSVKAENYLSFFPFIVPWLPSLSVVDTARTLSSWHSERQIMKLCSGSLHNNFSKCTQWGPACLMAM